MVAIGRGLMARPKLLMIDEPSLGLAPKVVDRVIEVAQVINRDGTAILLVEQDVLVALEAARPSGCTSAPAGEPRSHSA